MLSIRYIILLVFGYYFALIPISDAENASAFSGPPELKIIGVDLGDRSGCSLYVGDLNNDDIDDVIIGAKCADSHDNDDSGEVYIVLGSDVVKRRLDLSEDNPNIIRIIGRYKNGLLGSSLSVGDINNDGFDDLVIAAMLDGRKNKDNTGEVYIILGRPSFPSRIDLNSNESDVIRVYGANEGDLFGCSLATDDVNNDDICDVIIGSRSAGNAPEYRPGAVYILYGSENLPRIIDSSLSSSEMIKLQGENTGDYFGNSVAVADINSDGFNDILVGAPLSDNAGRYNSGKVYVLFGGNKFDSLMKVKEEDSKVSVIFGANSGDSIGEMLTSGDLNKDGYDDVIIGSLFNDALGRNDAGEITVIFGIKNLPSETDLSQTTISSLRIFGSHSNDFIGTSLYVGDISNDGIDDLIIGAPFASNGFRNEITGIVYVVPGSRSLNKVQSIDLYQDDSLYFKLSGETSGGKFGDSISVGDINNDDSNDIIIGASSADNGDLIDCGISFVYMGKSHRIVERPQQPVVDEIITNEKAAVVTIIGANLRTPTGNNYIEGGNSGYIDLVLRNTGNGTSTNLLANISTIEDISGLTFQSQMSISNIGRETVETLSIPVSADKTVGDMSINFMINVTWNGDNQTPVKYLRVETRKYKPSILIVEEREIEEIDGNGDKQIQAGEEIRATVKIRNIGLGTAENNKALISFGENVISKNGSNQEILLPAIQSDQRYAFSIDFSINEDALKVLPINVTFIDDSGMTSDQILLKLLKNSPLPPFSEPLPFDDLTLKDISLELPDVDYATNRGFVNPDGIAIIIGNKQYTSNNIPDVDYAHNDAEVLSEYIEKSFGFPSHQIITVPNATSQNLRDYFGNESFKDSYLYNKVEKGKTDLFVYYAGHGGIDSNTNKNYLTPVDILDQTPQRLISSGYPFEKLFRNLASLETRSLIVVLEACFSGLENLSSIVIEPTDNIIIRDNVVSITSSRNSEYSTWLTHRKHGMFSYFFLKAIREKLGPIDKNTTGISITAGDIFSIISDEGAGVPYWSKELYGRIQTPVLVGDRDTVLLKK